MRAPVLVLAVLLGCGYAVDRDRGHAPLPETGALPRVAVLPFDNESFRRGLEVRLTRLVDDELRARSPRAPRGADEADWLLTGDIVYAEEQVLTEDRADEVRESSFVITVRVRLENASTREVLRSYSFTEREPFSQRAGRVATVEQAAEEALRDLAESIVYWLEDHPTKESS